MNTISLTLPMERKALMRAAEMLHNLSSDLNPVISDEELNEAIMGAVTMQEEEPTQPVPDDPDPQVIFAAPKSEVYQINPQPAATATEPDTSETDTVAANPSPNTLPAGVEVDSAGLPWDERIHSSSKGKMKGDKTWKKKRGVDAATVEQVEAELRQLMQAQPGQAFEPPKPAETAAAPTPSTSNPVAPTTGAADAAPPAEPAPQTPPPAQDVNAKVLVGAIPTTFPGLMTEITSKGIAAEVSNAACRAHGVQSLVMLAARPDLIPHVAAELFKVE